MAQQVLQGFDLWSAPAEVNEYNSYSEPEPVLSTSVVAYADTASKSLSFTPSPGGNNGYFFVGSLPNVSYFVSSLSGTELIAGFNFCWTGGILLGGTSPSSGPGGTFGICAFLSQALNYDEDMEIAIELGIDIYGILHITDGGSNGGHLYASGTTPLINGKWYHIDFQANLSSSVASASCFVNLDGVLEATVSSGTNTNTGDVYDFDSFYQFGVGAANLPSSISEITLFFDDVYVYDLTGSSDNAPVGFSHVHSVAPSTLTLVSAPPWYQGMTSTSATFTGAASCTLSLNQSPTTVYMDGFETYGVTSPNSYALPVGSFGMVSQMGPATANPTSRFFLMAIGSQGNSYPNGSYGICSVQSNQTASWDTNAAALRIQNYNDPNVGSNGFFCGVGLPVLNPSGSVAGGTVTVGFAFMFSGALSLFAGSHAVPCIQLCSLWGRHTEQSVLELSLGTSSGGGITLGALGVTKGGHGNSRAVEGEPDVNMVGDIIEWSSTPVLQSGLWCYLEISAILNGTASTYAVSVNGSSVMTGTFNAHDLVQSNSETQFLVSLVGAGLIIPSVGVTGAFQAWPVVDFYFDDVYVNSTSIMHGPVRVSTLFPASNGAVVSWTPSSGSNYQCVNVAPPPLTSVSAGNPTNYIIAPNVLSGGEYNLVSGSSNLYNLEPVAGTTMSSAVLAAQYSVLVAPSEPYVASILLKFNQAVSGTTYTSSAYSEPESIQNEPYRGGQYACCCFTAHINNGDVWVLSDFATDQFGFQD